MGITLPSGSYALIGRPLVRMLLASAATAAAIALAACDSETLTRSSLRADQPLSPKILADIQQKGMLKETPILVRIFKEEAELEVWKQTREGRYALLKTYPICRWSGELGPKLKQGDRQAPEGFYTITPGQMNPQSSYYLAFNMGYPNAFDRAHGRTGSELMVHGDCSSRGCYAMTDEQMGEIYALAREAFFGGQRAFQVQAYPFRMTPLNMARHRTNPHIPFWRALKRGYDHFEVTRLEPKVAVCEKHYVFDANAPEGAATPVSFNPAGKCPAYEVPSDILAAVKEKQRRDDAETAALVAYTPIAPIKTGTDGGMNPVYLAALRGHNPEAAVAAGTTANALAATPHGTIPQHVNPPQAPQPVYASKQTIARTNQVVLASADAEPEALPASGDGFFTQVSKAIGLGGTATEEPDKLVGRPRPVETVRRAAPAPRPQVAAARPPTPTPAPPSRQAEPPVSVAAYQPEPAEAAPARPTLRGTSASPAPAAPKAARPAWANRPAARAPAPVASLSSPSTMTSLAGPVIRGAQPTLRTGSFENRWSALR